MDALARLTWSLRYGDVRATSTGALATVVAGLVVRTCVGLPAAVTGLDDEAAVTMRRRIDSVHSALKTLADETLTARWLETIEPLVDRADLPGLLAGRLTRMVFDEQRLTTADVAAPDGPDTDRWCATGAGGGLGGGFLAGGGLLLVHDEHLLRPGRRVDRRDLFFFFFFFFFFSGRHVHRGAAVAAAHFAEYEAPQRRAIGEKVRRGGVPAERDDARTSPLDQDRVALILPVLRQLLAVEV